nr:hypothetical protein [Tanacetum cinerariifolium]
CLLLYHFKEMVEMGGDGALITVLALVSFQGDGRNGRRWSFNYELEKLVVGSGAAKYVQILRRRRERVGVKLGLLKDLLRHACNETYERQLELDAVDND